MKPIFMRQPKDSRADHRGNGGNRNWDRFVTHVGHGHPAILPTIRRILYIKILTEYTFSEVKSTLFRKHNFSIRGEKNVFLF